ncbi:hypothetical protein EJ04DRAFT_547037 [Polyplosphaeria fusca]|uniref:Uncharacterized protein n=1 Tax=Polyplosphaeria fusca TaxID=682080 RepID=A0A9P4QK11_9PLEO|nr:hypothetical protein EJ04DRAFT_547037 [Polyplosphaeria fusca]
MSTRDHRFFSHSPTQRILRLAARESQSSMDKQKANGLEPPISKNMSLLIVASTSSGFGVGQPVTAFRVDRLSRLDEELSTWPATELKTPRLNDIHHHLWLAGPPTAARPLHRQRLMGRNILITEDPDEHLVWFEDQIFIKPLPDFLLDWESWKSHLCSDLELRKAACGLLLSYAWLVRYKSDLDIAKGAGLMLKVVEWPNWVEFINFFLANIDCKTLSSVNQRYRYGELRLTRLDTIYRLSPPIYSLRNFIWGYQSRPTWYQAFFGRNFRWMLAGFASLAVLMAALQVGLATIALQGNAPFQKVSYGLTITCLVAVAASLAVIILVR